MITTTNDTPNGDNYPCDFGGSITFEKIDESYSDYKFEVVGLTNNPFEFWIPKTIAGTTIDYVAVAHWLMEHVETATEGYNSTDDEKTIAFSLNNITSGVAELDVSGYYSCTLLDEQNGTFYLTIFGVGANSYDVEPPVSESGGNSSWPDPGDVFRWLMKKLKEFICPECS